MLLGRSALLDRADALVAALFGRAGSGAGAPSTMRAYAARAGYSHVEVAPVEHDLFRFFVLTP